MDESKFLFAFLSLIWRKETKWFTFIGRLTVRFGNTQSLRFSVLPKNCRLFEDVVNAKQAELLHGIGASMAKKIRTILEENGK